MHVIRMCRKRVPAAPHVVVWLAADGRSWDDCLAYRVCIFSLLAVTCRNNASDVERRSNLVLSTKWMSSAKKHGRTGR